MVFSKSFSWAVIKICTLWIVCQISNTFSHYSCPFITRTWKFHLKDILTRKCSYFMCQSFVPCSKVPLKSSSDGWIVKPIFRAKGDLGKQEVVFLNKKYNSGNNYYRCSESSINNSSDPTCIPCFIDLDIRWNIAP